MSKKNNGRTYKHIWDTYIVDVVDFILVLVGIVIGLFAKNQAVFRIALIITAIAVVARIVLMIYRGRTLPNYNRLLRQERYSNGTFLALQNANWRKTQEVMRYTYGKVATWNPINYYRNLLTYDIHEQIRSILISLRDLIIDMDESGRLNSDNVTVDLLYFYKPLPFTEELPAEKNTDNDQDDGPEQNNHDAIEDEPRLISSGDNDLENSPRVLLCDRCSFYWYVRTRKGGYCFANDKNKLNPCIRNDKGTNMTCSEEFHYIVTKKDLRYDTVDTDKCARKRIKKVTAERDPDRSRKYAKYPLIEPGSIVCSFFNLHNDVPSEICVSAVLTITTYGQKLYDDSKNGASFEEDFRSKVLHSYKSLLISELAQMYIRHSVNCGKRNPFTGKPVKNSKLEDERILKEKLDRTMVKVENLINTSFNMVEATNNTANGNDELITKDKKT
ncbi:MAG: hypothetical protein II059_06020 [Clostridia bacterium]|nr:hypothetical protein [Clostridia bacterium]